MTQVVRQIVELLRREPKARVFFPVLGQSALGTGAGYIALLLLAYDRFDSAWAIGLVLLADVIPAMALGPLFGAAADRWSRRSCMIAADLVRVVAFTGVVLVDGFAATVAFAVLAGVGTGLFTPAALSSLPSLVEARRLPAATSLYGAVGDLGFIAGPGIAAGLLAVVSPETLLLGNAASFAASAAALSLMHFGTAPSRAGAAPRESLLRDAREGVKAAAAMAGLRTILFASGVALFFGGVFNVGELPLARALGASDVGFSLMVTLYGLGFIGGSLAGSDGGDLALLKRRYLLGATAMACGFAGAGLASTLMLALLAFVLAGFGNGLLLVYERLLIQALVPDALSGRVFGIKDALTAWAFALAFLTGPALIEGLDVRVTVFAAGCGGLVVAVASAFALRNLWRPPRSPELVGDTHATTGPHRGLSEDRAHVAGGGAYWLSVFDDLH